MNNWTCPNCRGDTYWLERNEIGKYTQFECVACDYIWKLYDPPTESLLVLSLKTMAIMFPIYAVLIYFGYVLRGN